MAKAVEGQGHEHFILSDSKTNHELSPTHKREANTLADKSSLCSSVPVSRKKPAPLRPASRQGLQPYLAESCGPSERGTRPRAQAVPFLLKRGRGGALCCSWSGCCALRRAPGCFVTRRHGDAGHFLQLSLGANRCWRCRASASSGRLGGRVRKAETCSQ